MRKLLLPLSGGAATVVLMGMALRGADLGSVAQSLSAADLTVIPAVIIVTLLELLFRSLRWKLLLSPLRKVRLRDTFRLESAALALSNILPLRLGEAVRAAYGASIFGLPASTVFSSMLVERAMDAAVLALLFLLAAASGAAPPVLTAGKWAWLLAASLTGGLALLALSGNLKESRLFRAFAEGFPRLSSAAAGRSDGAAALRSPGTAAAVCGLAALQWLMDALNLYLIGLAFHLGALIDPGRAVVLLFAGALAVSAPGVPGYFGNFEFATAGTAASWGVPKAAALAFAAFAHVLNYLIFTGVGLVFVYGMGQSLGTVWRSFAAGGQAAEPAAAPGREGERKNAF